MYRILASSLIALLISGGCTMGPDYSRPEITTPASWTVSFETAGELTDQAWWQQFNDPVIDELVTTALAQNLDLKAALARIDQYLGQLRTTRAEFFPELGASASAFRRDDTDTGLSAVRGAYSSYAGALNASWEIDLWGGIRRSNEAAQAELLASEAGRRGILLTVVSDVVSNYMILRGLDRQLEIAEETKRNYEESLRIFHHRHRYGTVSQIEVSQVQSEYENARQTIPNLELQISRQEHLLAFLLGQNPHLIPRGKAIGEIPVLQIPQDLPSTLLQQRPDIIQAEQQLIAANARIGVARAQYFPNLSLTGAFGTATITSDKLFDASSQAWSIGADILAPIFTFGRIEGQVMSSEAAQREALYNYRQTILSAFRDVEDALIKTTKGRERQAAQMQRTKALETYSRLARDQYESGTTGYLQVLDANRSLFSSQLDSIQTQTEALTGLVDVYRSLGGGWVDIADGMSLPSEVEKETE